MITQLTQEELEKLHSEILAWVKEVLPSAYGTYVYNVLHSIRHMIELYGKESLVPITFTDNEREILNKWLNGSILAGTKDATPEAV